MATNFAIEREPNFAIAPAEYEDGEEVSPAEMELSVTGEEKWIGEYLKIGLDAGGEQIVLLADNTRFHELNQEYARLICSTNAGELLTKLKAL